MNYFFCIFRKVPGLNIPTNGTSPAPVSLSLNSTAVSNQPTPSSILASTPDPESPSASMLLGENGLAVDPSTDGDWSYDPNEPRYCVCNQVSYGDMVACDNDAVSILAFIHRFWQADNMIGESFFEIFKSKFFKLTIEKIRKSKNTVSALERGGNLYARGK